MAKVKNVLVVSAQPRLDGDSVASEATGIPEKSFYVFIKENDGDNVAVGGTLLSDR